MPRYSYGYTYYVVISNDFHKNASGIWWYARIHAKVHLIREQQMVHMAAPVLCRYRHESSNDDEALQVEM